MAVLVIDGFDKYGPAGISGSLGSPLAALTTAVQAEWTTLNTWTELGYAAIVSGLNGISGQALNLIGSADGACSVDRTLAANYARLIAGARFKSSLTGSAGQPPGIYFLDGTTVQLGVVVNASTGTLALVYYQPSTGLAANTVNVYATSATSVTADSVHYLEVDASFGASATVNVWLDGVQIADISGTYATNRSGHSYANAVRLGAPRNGNTVAGATFAVDDFYLFDTSGSTNNAVLNTNPRIETQLPSSAVQTNFAIPAGVLGYAYTGYTSTNSPGANQLALRKFTPAAAATINSIGLMPGANSAGAKFKPVIYSDSAGAPSTLLSTGSEVVGATSGTALTLALTSPQSLVAGTPVWIGYITDTSVALALTASSGTPGYKASNTYASGAPGTAPSMTSGQSPWQIWGNVTGLAAGWSAVNQVPPVASLSYISDANVGDEDLYAFPAITTNTTVVGVYTMKVSGYMSISGSGARTVNLIAKSSGVEGTGSAGAFSIPSGSPVYENSYFDTDPSTGLAWTQARVNAASAGIKIAT